MKHAAWWAAIGVYIRRVRGEYLKLLRIEPKPVEPEVQEIQPTLWTKEDDD